MRARRYTVAVLAGDGIGPEVTAEASRALAEVAGLHGFRLDEVHLPFGGDAVRRVGHPLPAATRRACRSADAVLVAATREPALEGVKAELDLTWRVTRVALPGDRGLAVVSPLVPEADASAVARAFALAVTRRARVVSVGTGPAWRDAVAAATERYDGVEVEHLRLEEALPALAREPERFDVVVTEGPLSEAVSNMAAFADKAARVVASGRLSDAGPGVFGPTHGSALEIAGQGVANPSGMLLAAALMLGEGLGERAAARTLERAVGRTLTGGARTPDLVRSGVAATTREFMDALLAELPRSRTDTEFFVEAA